MNKLFSNDDPTKNKNNQDQITNIGINHPKRTNKQIYSNDDKQGFDSNPYGQKGYPGPQTENTMAEKNK